MAVRVRNKDIKASLCLSYDAFELLETIRYKFDSFWTTQCMLKVRHCIFISCRPGIHAFVVDLVYFYKEGRYNHLIKNIDCDSEACDIIS